jgi:hypothetical protein
LERNVHRQSPKRIRTEPEEGVDVNTTTIRDPKGLGSRRADILLKIAAGQRNQAAGLDRRAEEAWIAVVAVATILDDHLIGRVLRACAAQTAGQACQQGGSHVASVGGAHG